MGLFDVFKTLFESSTTKKLPKKTKKKITKKPKKKIAKPFEKKKTKKKLKKSPKKAKRISKRQLIDKKPKQSKERKNKILRSAQDNSTKSTKGGQVSLEKEIGVITHYFGKISVGIIKLKSELKVGDKIQIKGANDDFKQTIKSMQYNHIDISFAKKGYEIGIKVAKLVHENDKVYKITD